MPSRLQPDVATSAGNGTEGSAAAPQRDAIVELHDLHRDYHMGGETIHALAGMNLKIYRGEFMSIMGRSGSGKSTLLNMIGCLDRPTSGNVIIDGIDVTQVPRRQLPRIRREKVGFVFQQHNLVPILTAEENVALPLRYASASTRERRERARAALAAVSLDDRLSHKPTELSGGQQQRVAIARALVTDPAIVLADEPTGELDTQTAAGIIELMHEMNEQRGQTFIIVTHDPGVAERTNRIIQMSDGHVTEDSADSPASVTAAG
ncbi:MAG: hypothetical protein CL878_07275 [Dehalococcoidia bacterium]|nr:hypothetical protein [Dehalococcoidia bacterium]